MVLYPCFGLPYPNVEVLCLKVHFAALPLVDCPLVGYLHCLVCRGYTYRGVGLVTVCRVVPIVALVKREHKAKGTIVLGFAVYNVAHHFAVLVTCTVDIKPGGGDDEQ